MSSVDFNLDDAPRIADFSLTLAEESEGGLHIRMMSRSRGHLGGFPAWEHADRDLRHFTHDDIPLGEGQACRTSRRKNAARGGRRIDGRWIGKADDATETAGTHCVRAGV